MDTSHASRTVSAKYAITPQPAPPAANPRSGQPLVASIAWLLSVLPAALVLWLAWHHGVAVEHLFGLLLGFADAR